MSLKGPSRSPSIRLLDKEATARSIDPQTPFEDLLESVVISGHCVKKSPDSSIRAHAQSELSRFEAGVRAFQNPSIYPVGLEARLYNEKMRLFKAHR